MEIDLEYIQKKCVPMTGIKEIPEKTIEELLKRMITEQSEYNTKILNLLNELTKSSTIYEKHYFDISGTVSTAVTTKPESAESTSYTRGQVHERINRNAKKLSIYNDGPGTLYVVIYHQENQPSPEFPLYEGEAKTYMNVFEVKVRAPVAGLKYRITEYELWKQKNVDFKAGRGYIRNQTLVTGNVAPAVAYTTGDTHSINTTLQRNATTGYIKNRDAVATLFYWISIDGTNYGTVGTEYGTIDPNSALNIDGWEVFSLIIGANINNVAYEVALG